MKTQLLLIDPQQDFCDPEKGTLYVPGAEQDMARLAAFVRQHRETFDAIHVTLDTHHYVDIAHPVFWQDAGGNHPAPFTPVSVADVESRRWIPTVAEAYDRALDYVRSLEWNGRYALFIWPYHCLLGSPGHAVQPDLFAALQEWEEQYAIVNYVQKGSNIWTEHYSAIQAEVPDPNDPATQLNRTLLNTLLEADTVLIAGEAGSHCVANTVRDIADYFKDACLIQKLCLLTDAVSPVSGFEKPQADFITELALRGMRTATTADYSR